MNKAALWLGAATVVAGLSIHRPAAAAAEPFQDVPTDHWAYQAVNNLQERGIVIGYPDGTFGGRRAMTRYEFAVAVDRLVDWVNRSIASVPKGLTEEDVRRIIRENPGVTEDRVRELIQEQIRNLPTKEDLETIRRLTDEFRDELSALGTNVEALRRDLDALKARVGAIEERLNRWHFSGEANLIARGELGQKRDVTGFGDARRAPIDLDSRTDNNGSADILEGVKTLYSLDFGVTGRVSSGVTANALFNFGNYLPWVNSNRQNPGVDATRGNNQDIYAGDVSTVPTLPNTQGPGAPKGNALSNRTITQGNFGTIATNDSYSEFTPVKMYLNSPVRDLWFLKDNDLTVGKFGVQFTPYTLKQVDPDSYTNVTLTDNGEVIGTGAMARTTIAGIHFLGYAATHYNGQSVNTGYPLFISWGGPHVLAAMDYGALPIDQSIGVHGTYKLSRFDIGGTYLEGGLSDTVAGGPSASPFGNPPWSDRPNPHNDDRAMIPKRAQVFGGDLRFPIFSRLAFAGEFSSSNTLAGKLIGDREGVYPINMRNAYDAKLTWGSGRLTVAGGYKQIDPFFGAPGAWGNIGRWKNPTNIKGWDANAGYNFGGFTLKGSWEDYRSVRVDRSVGTTLIMDDAFHNKIQHYTAGVSFNLNPTNGIDLGWEQARVEPWNTGGAKTRENYYTIGLGHTFNQNTLVKVLYQIIDYKDNGAGLYTVPGGAYRGGIGVTQLSVRF